MKGECQTKRNYRPDYLMLERNFNQSEHIQKILSVFQWYLPNIILGKSKW